MGVLRWQQRWWIAILWGLLLPAWAHALSLSGGGGGGGFPSGFVCPDVGGNHVNITAQGVVECGVTSSGTGSIGNGAADGVTKGIVAFQAARFTCASGICDLATTLDGRTLTNPTITVNDGATFTLQKTTDTSSQVRFSLTGVPTATTVTLTTPAASGTLLTDNNVVTVTGKTFTNAVFTGTTTGITATMVGLGNVDNTSDATKNAAVASLTNKTLDATNTVTLKDTLWTLQDDGDATKQARWQLSGITTGTLRTYTMPDASDTLMCLTCPQTATNKTLTSPTINALANLTTNGFVKTSGGTGTLGVDTATYTPTTRGLTTTAPLAGGGDLSADRTLSCPTCTTNASALTANLPVIGSGGQGVALGTRSGTTTAFVTLSGLPTSGTCAQFDASGNVASTGSACGSGGGGGAVSSVFGRAGAVVATTGDYTEAQISFSDITANNASTTAHGYLKKLSGIASEFLNGQGNFVVPASGGSGTVALGTVNAAARYNAVDTAVGPSTGVTLSTTKLLTTYNATTTISTNTTLGDANIVRCVASGGTVTLTMPSVATTTTGHYTIVKDDATGVCQVARAGSDTFNGLVGPLVLSKQYDAVVLDAYDTSTGIWWYTAIKAQFGYVQLNMKGADLPTSNAAIIDVSEPRPKLVFDASTSWCASWTFSMNPDYGVLPQIVYKYSMTSPTSGSTKMDWSVWKTTAAQAEDGEVASYDSVNTCTDATVPATTGRIAQVTCPLVTVDGMAANDQVTIKACRNVTGTATGSNLELLSAQLQYFKQ